MQNNQAAHLADRAVLALGGDRARDFLQGLVSNDVTRLSPERAVYAALLTPQGKYLFDFFLYQGDDAILIDVEADRLGELQQRLTLYRLRVPVRIEPRPELGVVTIWGDGAGILGSDATVVVQDPRLPALGTRVVVAADASPAFAASEGLSLAPAAAYDAHRLALGVPDGGRDLVVGKSILTECNFEELNGVDFRKGCFVGQELTARTKHRGLVRKRLLPVTLEGPAVAPGTVIKNGEREAGELRSSLGGRGLALLRLEHLDGPELLAGATRVTPRIPDWLRLPSADAPSRVS